VGSHSAGAQGCRPAGARLRSPRCRLIVDLLLGGQGGARRRDHLRRRPKTTVTRGVCLDIGGVPPERLGSGYICAAPPEVSPQPGRIFVDQPGI
jgi:hypothetical protein